MSQRSDRFNFAAVAAFAAAAVSLSFTAASPALAQQIVVPGGQAAAEGNTNNFFPFDIGATSQRYQQVYGAAAFGGPAGPLLITQIAFRPDNGNFGTAFSSTLPNVRIDLSTTSAAVDGLSTAYADNVGANNVTIFSGALSLSSSSTPAAGGTRAFDIVINLATPFLYDPAAGNLLLDVYNFAGGNTTLFDAQNTTGDAVSRIYNNGAGVNASFGTADSIGLVTRFTASAVAVPEASALALALPALAMVGAVFAGKHSAVIKRRRKSA